MNRKLRYSILAADLAWITISCWLIDRMQQGLTAASSLDLINVASGLPLWSILYFSKNLEGFRGGWHLPRICAQVIVGVTYLSGILLVMSSLVQRPNSLASVLEQGCLIAVGLIAIRCIARWLVASTSRTAAKCRVVILGNGRIVRELALSISRHPETAMEVVGVLCPSETGSAKSLLSPGTVSIRTLNILGFMREKGVQELIVVEPLPPGMETAKLISNCRSAGIGVRLVPHRYELFLSKADLTEIDGIPLLSMEPQSLPVFGLELKRIVDVTGASVFLILSFPLLVLSAVALYLDKGRAFRKERRCGKDGRLFWMRRLNIDREAPDLAAYERILLQFSLTELPQLWNVFRGEMSLVGPRPESVDRVKHYSMWQRQRLAVTPGLTGLAQVHGLRDQHSSDEKARFDLQYIFHWSLFLDLSLLLQTIWILATRLVKQERFPASSQPARRLLTLPE
jgi:lipopolysaccharide/colanic/teichoic acid biosynthesis glycosyltransferase